MPPLSFRTSFVLKQVAILLLAWLADLVEGAPVIPAILPQSSVIPPANSPLMQQTPTYCYGYFPGTPGWNECVHRINAMNSAPGILPAVAPIPYASMSSSFMNFNSLSNSNSFVGGYGIHAVNVPMSTNILNNVLSLTLLTSPLDKFDTKVVGNVLTLSTVSSGQPKLVQITIPSGIKIEDVKVDQAPGVIHVAAPTAILSPGGSFQMTQFDSTGTGLNTGTFSHFGNFQTGSMPPIIMPDFQSFFNNIFHNVFGSMFGMFG